MTALGTAKEITESVVAVMAGLVPAIHVVVQGKRFPQFTQMVVTATERSLVTSMRRRSGPT